MGDATRHAIQEVLALASDGPYSGGLLPQPGYRSPPSLPERVSRFGPDDLILRDALLQRDITIDALQDRLVVESRRQEEECRHLQIMLRDQAAQHRDRLRELGSRIESLQFAALHQGITRERFESLSAKAVADEIAVAARRASTQMAEDALRFRSMMHGSCERTLDRLRTLTVLTRESLPQNPHSDTMVQDVKELLATDRARQLEETAYHFRNRSLSVIESASRVDANDELLRQSLLKRLDHREDEEEEEAEHQQSMGKGNGVTRGYLSAMLAELQIETQHLPIAPNSRLPTIDLSDGNTTTEQLSGALGWATTAPEPRQGPGQPSPLGPRIRGRSAMMRSHSPGGNELPYPSIFCAARDRRGCDQHSAGNSFGEQRTSATETPPWIALLTAAAHGTFGAPKDATTPLVLRPWIRSDDPSTSIDSTPYTAPTAPRQLRDDGYTDLEAAALHEHRRIRSAIQH